MRPILKNKANTPFKRKCRLISGISVLKIHVFSSTFLSRPFNFNCKILNAWRYKCTEFWFPKEIFHNYMEWKWKLGTWTITYTSTKKLLTICEKKIMLSMPAHLILRKASEKNSPLKKVKNLNDQRRSARMMSRLSTWFCRVSQIVSSNFLIIVLFTLGLICSYSCSKNINLLN